MVRLFATTTATRARHPAARLAALALVFACAALAARPLPAQVAALARQEPIVAIGALDGPDEEVFGRIEAIAIDNAGNVFVLDALAHEVRWFGPDGAFRGRAAAVAYGAA
jgi:hypothetical protein